MPIATTNPDSRRVWRSTAAVFLGLIAVVVLSLATDQVFHWLRVYPPWGEPMNGTGQLLLALTYRCVYGVLGSYIAAWYAPHAPMRHAMVVGLIGFVLSSIGAFVAIYIVELGAAWYPIALLLTALPCAWLGGVLYRARSLKG